MTAEEKALERFPDKDDLFNIGTEDNFTHNEIAFLERVAFRRGWNDRDSLVEAEKKEAVDGFKEYLRKKLRVEIMKANGPQAASVDSMMRNQVRSESYKYLIELLTPEDK